MTAIKVKVTRNFQVTIPEGVRKKIRLEEGDTVEVEAIDSDRILLKRIIPIDQLEGVWKDEKNVDEAMSEVRKLWKTWKTKPFA